jgi:UDP-2-acetamido-2,6-beta-L-arabino-hexul-4-ose reductase
MKVLVTGANGFIGKNLLSHLRQQPEIKVLTFLRGEPESALKSKVSEANFVFHLAGVNRPKTESEFDENNATLTRTLCKAIHQCNRLIPVVYSSSVQAEHNNAYGASKRAAESFLTELRKNIGSQVYIYRLPNVFGKWAKPNYNSVVTTFCHNIARDLPVQVNEPAKELKLVYVEDVITEFSRVLKGQHHGNDGFKTVEPTYEITLGELVRCLKLFKQSRASLVMEPVGTGLIRALYSTFISYLEPEQFSYSLAKQEDNRGLFVEVLKTKDAGQFSYFTAAPGVTRGGHFHHTKTEKFLVVKGIARFSFRNVDTGRTHEHTTKGGFPEIVEAIPGWSHQVTNIGEEEIVVMLWANEIFDRKNPDTTSYKV